MEAGNYLQLEAFKRSNYFDRWDCSEYLSHYRQTRIEVKLLIYFRKYQLN